MKTEIYDLTDQTVRNRLSSALDTISRVITGTMGPKGKTCILYNGESTPHVTKDGVTVAEFLRFEDPFVEAINLLVKETARKTAESVGDGTTTSVLLACNMCKAVLEQQEDDVNVISRLEKDSALITQYITDHTMILDKSNNQEQLNILRSIVHISSNGDTGITDLILNTIEKVGVDGLIDVTTATGNITETVVREGMLIEAPAMNLTAANDVLTPNVLLVAGAIDKIHQFKSCMQVANTVFNAAQTPTIIIAKEFSKEVQDIVLANNRNNKFAMYLVESDGFGNGALEILDDMSVVLQCKIMSTDNTSPYAIQNVTADSFANIASATVTPTSTVLYPLYSLSDDALAIKESILTTIETVNSSGEAVIGSLAHLHRRLSKFSKSATIKVGGITDADKIERKDRVDDAVSALYAAIKGGVVPGGGYMLLNAAKNTACSSLMKTVCYAPALKLHSNVFEADLESILIDNNVINSATGEQGDAITLGILDPADVQIKSLQQAVVITKTIVNSTTMLIPTQHGEI